MPTRGRALSVLIHAGSKMGKSTFGITTPPPRLLLDAESAYRFLPIRRVFWNPLVEPPPIYDETWDTCVVIVHDYTTFERAIDYLIQGMHPFESVTVDSVSEVQKKCRNQISGSPSMINQKWQELLWHMDNKICALRDLTEHATHPLTAVILTAMTNYRENKWRPYVQGQLATKLPYYIDLVGYLYMETQYSTDPTQPPIQFRRLATRPSNLYEAGERVQGRIPEFVDDACINASWMLDAVFGPLTSMTSNGFVVPNTANSVNVDYTAVQHYSPMAYNQYAQLHVPPQ